MSTLPVLLLLFYNAYVLVGALLDKRLSAKGFELPTILFFCSGMPALIYQIVWQRALFAIYGVNSESVAVIVSAFMIGLGLGSLLGGWLSLKFPSHNVLLFGIAELSVALFGLCSLHLFHWVASHTAGSPLAAVVVLSLSLLIFPTLCMGATLPLLADYLVRSSRNVGYSVGALYFSNTFGSAFACYLCAKFLLRDYGQSGSVRIAVCMNIVVAASVLLLCRFRGQSSPGEPPEVRHGGEPPPALSLGFAMSLAASVGFVSLGLEIIWFRVFVLASSDRAPAFALLLSTFLSGIAAGAFIAGKLTTRSDSSRILGVIASLIFLAGGISCYLTPLVGFLASRGLEYLIAAPAYFLVAALLGSVFTLVCKLAVPANTGAGVGVSRIYIANIAGSAAGSLLVGFVLMNHFGILQITLLLGAIAFLVAFAVLLRTRAKFGPRSRVFIWMPAATALALAVSPALYSRLFEKLVFGQAAKSLPPFSQILENRNGVITVAQDGAVFGSGVYDGYFNVDPIEDKNMIVRAYALSAFHPAPKRMLMIGLSSGSWAQVLANNPVTESLEIIEINPGYLELIGRYPSVRSLLVNPKVKVHIDDGRRWLLANPDLRYDVIVQNTSFYWRDHSSELLSADYLRIIKSHLTPGGLYYYNTTGSDDVVATGLSVFRFGLRVINFLAVSDAPIAVEQSRWFAILRRYSIDGKLIFDPSKPASLALLDDYSKLIASRSQPQTGRGMETSDSMRARIKDPLIITDDNMGWEWRELK